MWRELTDEQFSRYVRWIQSERERGEDDSQLSQLTDEEFRDFIRWLKAERGLLS